MRKIRFRAWHHGNKRMWQIIKLGWVWSVLSDGRISSNFEEYNDKFELMQFTGLKDREGIEIYEGDIVSWGGKEFEIIFEKDKFLAYNKKFNTRVDWWAEFKVIGNIHER